MKCKLLVVLCLPVWLMAQQRYEAGVMLGGMSYNGDLGPRTFQDHFEMPHLAAGVFVRQHFNKFFSAKVNLAHGNISGDDRSWGNKDSRYKRNLNFKSAVSEIAVTGELNLLPYLPESMNRFYSPYVFAGLSLFHFNPKAKYQGTWIELQPLGTEMQGGDKYARTQIAIPMGLGFRFAAEPGMHIGVELGGRKTFTDHLDDVSGTGMYDPAAAKSGDLMSILSYRAANAPAGYVSDGRTTGVLEVKRGNPKAKDWYYFGAVTLSFDLNTFKAKE